MLSGLEPDRLAQFPLFRGLDAEDLSRLAPSLHVRSYPAGASVLTAEQPGEAVYLVVQGRVKVFLERSDGTEVTIAFLGSGETVGEMSVIDSTVRCASVVTVEPSILAWMDRSLFQHCLETLPLFALNAVRQLTSRLRQANEQIEALFALDVPGRVARQLLALADQYGLPDEAGRLRIPLPLTQQDVADMVGATRESVNRVMVALRQEGALEVGSDHVVTVLDRASLQARVGGL